MSWHNWVTKLELNMLASVGFGWISWVFCLAKQWKGKGEWHRGRRLQKVRRACRESDLRGGWAKRSDMKGSSPGQQSAGWVSAGTRSTTIIPPALVKRDRFITSLSSPTTSTFLSRLGKVSNLLQMHDEFYCHSQPLLKSLEICKIEPNMHRTDLTHSTDVKFARN